MSAHGSILTTDLSVVGVAELDLTRDVASFFAAHPFDHGPSSLDKLPVEDFFRRIFEACATSSSRIA